LGIFATVVGLAVSILGFVFTFREVRRAKTAAEQARQVARETKRSLLAANALVDFASAMAIMEEIRRLHRESAWRILPDRYSALRHALISVRSDHPFLTDFQKSVIQASVVQIRSMEQMVERALARNTVP
jgi:hypothetical protein